MALPSPRVPPWSALGTPLNPVQKDFFHLLASLLDLLKPDFAFCEVRAASPHRSVHGCAELTAYLFLPTTPPTLPSTHPRLLLTS